MAWNFKSEGNSFEWDNISGDNGTRANCHTPISAIVIDDEYPDNII